MYTVFALKEQSLFPEKITFTKSADFQKGMKPPSGRDTELYTQWISAVDQFVMEIEEEIQPIFVQCSKYLKVIFIHTVVTYGVLISRFINTQSNTLTTSSYRLWLTYVFVP